MALYKGTEKGKEGFRLIMADNPAKGLRHMAKGRFTLEAITDPSEAAKLGKEVEIEDADAPEPAPAPPPPPAPATPTPPPPPGEKAGEVKK